MSIILVVLSHSHWVSGHPIWMDAPQFRSLGPLGVRCFFVISGFLITLLMLREASRTGTVDIRSFYLRRVLRIFPAYFAFLAGLLVLQSLTKLAISSEDWLACLTFTRNFFGSGWITGHLWSLGIEQQFYLLWPLAFILSKPHKNPRRGLCMLLLPILICPMFRATAGLLGGDPLFSIFSFFLQADALAIGCLMAVLLWHYGDVIAGLLSRHRFWLAPLGLLLMLLPLFLPTGNRWWFLAGCVAPQAQAWGFSVLVVLAMQNHRWPIFRLLDSSPMVFIGAISYSLYIWQQFFCTNPADFGGGAAWWNSFPLWMIAALLAAATSHYLVEKPFLRLKHGGSKRETTGKNPLSSKAAQGTPES